MKRLKRTFVFAVTLFLIIVSVILSMNQFNTPNPMKSGIGLIKIVFTKAEIVQIQAYPKVYLAKPDDAQKALIAFMERQGYHYLKDERMASTFVFANETSKKYVDFSVNAYYSKWVFRE